MLGVRGSFGLLYSARPWLWGLAMGAWIPASGLVREFNFASLIALVFSFAGACTGALVRRKFIIVGDPGWVRSKPRLPWCGSTACC